jgi:hypothetical protein
MIPRLLFILRHREDPWGVPECYSHSLSSGLSNSVRFLVNALTARGVKADMVEAIDNNCIDRLVTQSQPTHVILEAFWVVPEKFDVLKKLHPTVRWIVRNHSEMPFLANEGCALMWVVGYMQRQIEVMSNSPRAMKSIRALAASAGLPESLATYGPNLYPEEGVGSVKPHIKHHAKAVDIGCFGAIRPLKNHLQQALAAMAFGDVIGKPVTFHINGTRCEGGGNPILKNLRSIFTDSHRHKLVEHPWLQHADFLKIMASIDIACQVSYTETFNIVAADAVASSVPVVCSSDIPWIGSYAYADPNSIETITQALIQIYEEGSWGASRRLHQQRRDLMSYCHASEAVWLDRFPVPGSRTSWF